MLPFKKMLILILVVFMTASCAGIERQIIIVEKQYETGMYEDFQEITNRKKVNVVKKILHNAKWQQMKVDMAREADYQFIFQFVDPNIQTKAILYSIWISPDKDTLEVVAGDNQYVHLNNEDSQKLFEALTDTNLADIN
ncbi:hypothetical protein ACQKII_23095 [Lysinibacillus sp. NPDC048646]|uniref:hypothetical protein n=1 Tax=Lysinibacillus sp. NPDC048646 TaxID=3390574 RepID=UPI003D02E0C0